MSSIHDDVRNGTLTATNLKRYVAQYPSILESTGGRENITPLAASASRGHLEAVNLLLDFNANPNAASEGGRTPLFYVTAKCRKRENRVAIVKALLDAGADINAPSPQDMNNTPLMNALARNKDSDLIQLLVDRGASLDLVNELGQNAKSLAIDGGVESYLLPAKERKSNLSATVNTAVAWISSVIETNQPSLVKDIVCSVVAKVLTRQLGEQANARVTRILDDEARATIMKYSPYRTPGVNPSDGAFVCFLNTKGGQRLVISFRKNLDDHIRTHSLVEFYINQSHFCQTIAERATLLHEYNRFYLTSGSVRRLSILSLYQIAIVCDNSQVMVRDNNVEVQSKFAETIGSVVTKLSPETSGVKLYFTNKVVRDKVELSVEEICKTTKSAECFGPCTVGTTLQHEILPDLVYRAIFNPRHGLSRPVLIVIVTQGTISSAERKEFENAIVSCKRNLEKARYDSSAVTFALNCIGGNKEARQFFQQLKEDPVTSHITEYNDQRLDRQYELLKDDGIAMEEWATSVLFDAISRGV